MMPTSRTAGKVEPLGDHLGADQHVHRAAAEPAEHGAQLAAVAQRVGVEALYAQPRHRRRQFLLDALRAVAAVADVQRGALRAHAQRRCPVAAVVAQHDAVRLVEGEAHRAAHTAHLEAAAAAVEEIGEPAPVQKQDRLAAGGRGGANLGQQPLRQRAGLALHLHHLDGRHARPARAAGQVEPVQHAAPHVVQRLQRRGGAAHHQGGALGGTAVHRHLAGVKAGRGARLVGGFVLLVDHHQAEVAERGKHRAARPDHHARRAAADAPPLLQPLRGGERGMDHRHLVAEHVAELVHHLMGQGDLRHQVDHPAAGRHHALGRGHEHRRLAGTGHSAQVEARRLRVAGGMLRVWRRQRRQRAFLLLGQVMVLPPFDGAGRLVGQDLAPAGGDHGGQRLAHGTQVGVRYPPRQPEQRAVEHRLCVHPTPDGAQVHAGGRLARRADHEAGDAPFAERRHHANATHGSAVVQVEIGERLLHRKVERDLQVAGHRRSVGFRQRSPDGGTAALAAAPVELASVPASRFCKRRRSAHTAPRSD